MENREPCQIERLQNMSYTVTQKIQSVQTIVIHLGRRFLRATFPCLRIIDLLVLQSLTVSFQFQERKNHKDSNG